MPNPLSHLEDLAEQLVEGPFARVFRARLQPIEVARRIARAMEDGQVINAQGQVVVPNAYQVYLSPADLEALESYRDALQDELVRYVATLARNAGATMPGRPRVFLQANANVSLRRVRIEARLLGPRQRGVTPGHTQAMPSMHAPAANQQARFILLDGYRRMPLTEAVITIGRDLNNDIVFDDKRVSRQHAQLRRRYGQYVIYDLDSTGGTTVNGRPVREAPLQPGDVIGLSEVKIRFQSADAATPPGAPDTTPQTRQVPRPKRGARS
jgi:hypothetical protein